MEENNNPLDSGLHAKAPIDNLQITPVVRNTWREISYWALFLAILGFVSLGFMVISTFLGENRAGLASTVTGLLISGLLVFFPYWFLFNFAQQLRRSLELESTEAAELSFAHLSRFYQFIGILTIIVLGFFLIGGLSVLSLQMNR